MHGKLGQVAIHTRGRGLALGVTEEESDIISGLAHSTGPRPGGPFWTVKGYRGAD